MLHNIDLNKMNQLMKENKDAKQIISQLLENHHTAVSTIAHEIRNPTDPCFFRTSSHGNTASGSKRFFTLVTDA